MLALHRWLRHLANPIRGIFQLHERGFYIVQCLFLGNLKKKSNKQLLCKNATIYGVWSAIFFYYLLSPSPTSQYLLESVAQHMVADKKESVAQDRKSTRLNSSH